MTVRNWPVRFRAGIGGRVIATESVRSASPDMWEEICSRAEAIARIEACEVDVETASVKEDGSVGTWTRAGMRATA